MKCATALYLALAPATGLRRSTSKVSSWGGPALQASSEPDEAGVWSAMTPPGLFSASNLSFVAPGSKETMFKLQFSEVEGTDFEGGFRALRGTDGLSEMTAVLQTDKTIAGSIVDPETGMVHQFTGTDGGELTFTSINGDKFAEEGEPLADELPEEEEDADTAVAGPGIAARSVMDVMVVWTKAAECANDRKDAGCSVDSSTESKIRAKINLAIQETNDAYQVSNINAQLRLVHAYRHQNYTEKGFYEDLRNLAGGRIQSVFNKREKKKADIVALIVADKNLCGLANMGPGKNRMFSVTSQQCATGYYSFGHEIAHNLGCNHDRGAARACSSSRDNFGYRDPEGMWRDTLGYACKPDDCLKQQVRGRCTRMKFYSNPNVKYQGKASGWAGKADLAKQINKVRAQVAAYY